MSNKEGYNKDYYKNNKHKWKKYKETVVKKEPTYNIKYQKKYYKDNREERLKKQREFYHKNREKYKEIMNNFNKKLRFNILYHYSNGLLLCNCCGEKTIDFLSIDHINGNGNKHRKEVLKLGKNLYRWLRDNNFPEGFQVLCMNCNWGRARNNDICPHNILKSY